MNALGLHILQVVAMIMRINRISWALLYAILCVPAIARAQDEVVYYHTDAIGSVRMVTDATGAVIARYDFLPFGERWDSPPNPNPDVRQFTGNERDPETGLDYVGARYYRPQSGLFTTVDPGHVGGDIFDPQSWNAYSYALNNPLRFVDPMGTCSQDAKGNYFDGDDAGTLVTPGPCAINKGALDAGVTETVSVKSKPAIVALSEGIAPWAPVVNGIAIGTGVIVTGGTALGVASAATVGSGVGVEASLFGGAGGTMAAILSQVSNPSLRNALEALYQRKDLIRGGTPAAIRITAWTGQLVGGSDHLQKGADRMKQLANILKNPMLSPHDRAIAQSVFDSLKSALSGR